MNERSPAAQAYAPGVCNIGPSEIRVRWLLGHLGLLVTVGLLVVLLVFDAPALVRLVLALPAGATAFSYLEAHLRFCGSFGFLGVYNFGRLGSRQRVTDPEARGRDRQRALRLTALTVAIGLAVGVAAVVLPL